MSAAGRALSKALDKPEDWSGDGEFNIRHIPSGQDFWVRNGSFFFDIYGGMCEPEVIGLIERHWLYFKARKIIAKHASIRVKRRQHKKQRSDKVIARFKAAQE